jgi:hypothetical protein
MNTKLKEWELKSKETVSQSECVGEKKNLMPFPRFKSQALLLVT